MEPIDLIIISHLRKNAREKLTTISKKTGIPVSTIFSKIKDKYNHIIQKSTVILNLSKIGYEINLKIIVKTIKEQKENLKQYLMIHQNVNSLYKINNGYDFMIECYFKNMREANDFLEHLSEEYAVKTKQEYFMLEELKREGFMSNPEIMNIEST